MKKSLITLSIAASFLLGACSQNTNKVQNSGEPLETGIQSRAVQSEDAGMKLTKPAELYPEIAEIYKGIRILVVDKSKEESLKEELNITKDKLKEKLSVDEYNKLDSQRKKLEKDLIKMATVADIVAPFGEKVEVPNAGLIFELESFYPNFKMGAGKIIKDKDFLKESNPSAKLIIYESKKNVPIWNGWLFQQFPDMHPFEDPKYKLIFLESVKK